MLAPGLALFTLSGRQCLPFRKFNSDDFSIQFVSVGLLGAKLSLLKVLATLAMLTWLFEELQNKIFFL